MSSLVSLPVATELPPPRVRLGSSLEEVLRLRRSVRAYRDEPVPLASVAQLLWAAQGITDAEGHRTTPSAGAVYPLDALLIAGTVEDLEPGVYRYDPVRHHLEASGGGDVRSILARACFDQPFIGDASVSILLLARIAPMREKYGSEAEAYIAMEAGCALQNMALQAVALDLGSVIIGAFHEPVVAELLHLSSAERPVAMLTAGKPAPSVK